MSSGIRKSNMELLRIVSMAMVVAIHLNGAWTYVNEHFDYLSWRGFSLMLYQSFIIVAVNCFILISGFFGINPSKRGIWSFISCIIFYAIVCYGIGNLIGITGFSWRQIAACFYRFDSRLWFVSVYLILYLLSHFINKGIDVLSNKKLIFVCVIFISLDIILGWIANGALLFGSYQINHMLTVYIVGRTLARFKDRIIMLSPKTKLHLLAVYVGCSIVTALLTIHFQYEFPMCYNSVFVLLASVALFILFLNLNIQNRVINYIAGSAFSVFLLHYSNYIWWTILGFSYSMMDLLGEWGYNFIYVPALIIVLFAVVLLLDMVRRIVTRPFIALAVRVSNWAENVICKSLKINE